MAAVLLEVAAFGFFVFVVGDFPGVVE